MGKQQYAETRAGKQLGEQCGGNWEFIDWRVPGETLEMEYAVQVVSGRRESHINMLKNLRFRGNLGISKQKKVLV
jgi:hypothetical protein